MLTYTFKGQRKAFCQVCLTVKQSMTIAHELRALNKAVKTNQQDINAVCSMCGTHNRLRDRLRQLRDCSKPLTQLKPDPIKVEHQAVIHNQRNRPAALLPEETRYVWKAKCQMWLDTKINELVNQIT